MLCIVYCPQVLFGNNGQALRQETMEHAQANAPSHTSGCPSIVCLGSRLANLSQTGVKVD